MSRNPHKLLGLICWMLRTHKWRRLRRGEMSYIPAEQVLFNPKTHRVCARCGIVRGVKVRKAKGE